ncbi:MAG: cation-translocating P-type ATPase [Planctomycetota bacterium]
MADAAISPTDPTDRTPTPDRATADAIEAGAQEAHSERYVLLYLLGGLLVLTTLVSDVFGVHSPFISSIPALIGAIILATPLFGAAFSEIRRQHISSNTLASLAILAALVSQMYVIAGTLAFILLVADQFVRRTAWGAQRAIEQLIGLTPDTARVVKNGAERDLLLEEVTVGQTVRVRPGENLPVDGVVVEGQSTVNQASLTGEAVPVEVSGGDHVYAGTTNLTGGIDIRVTEIGAETTIGKVTTLIREAEQSKTPRQLIIEMVSRFFVPVVIAIAFITWWAMTQSDDPDTRAAAVSTFVQILVVTCPTALLLASPTAMVAAFAAAARLGILIKKTTYLEAAATIDTVVMDKTGTMTTGMFEVSRLAPADGVDGAELLTAAANGDQHSNHPLAQSILKTARSARIEPDGTKDYEELHGRGVRAQTSMGELCVGRSSWLLELNPEIRPELEAVEARIEGMSGVHVMRDGKYLGAVGLADTVKANTKNVIERLREIGVRRIAMFTGDRISVAKRVGVQVGVDAIEAECLPEEKHQQIQRLTRSGAKTLMVGDGINDGPSLAEADLGVAMGLSGSDIAANSAGVALMNDDLSRVPFLIELSRRARAIVTQNIIIAIVMALIGLALAATQTLDESFGPFLAGLYQFATGLIVIANSFRLFRFGEHIAESEQNGEQEGMVRREGSIRGLAPKPA